LLPPKHNTLVVAVIVAVGEPALGTVTEAVPVHPFASVKVTVYPFAGRPVAVELVPPVGAHEYVYGPTPPETETDADPFDIPQVACVNDVEAVNAGGCVMLNVCVIVHPAAGEETVTV
jgi:hypothetical protein